MSSEDFLICAPILLNLIRSLFKLRYNKLVRFNAAQTFSILISILFVLVIKSSTNKTCLWRIFCYLKIFCDWKYMWQFVVVFTYYMVNYVSKLGSLRHTIKILPNPFLWVVELHSKLLNLCFIPCFVEFQLKQLFVCWILSRDSFRRKEQKKPNEISGKGLLYLDVSVYIVFIFFFIFKKVQLLYALQLSAIWLIVKKIHIYSWLWMMKADDIINFHFVSVFVSIFCL